MNQSTSSIVGELRQFLNGVLSSTTPNVQNVRSVDTAEIVKTASNLLKQLPAAREAVFYYFCQVIDEAIMQHLRQPQGEPPNKKRVERDAVGLVHDILSSFIKSNPRGWAPIISTWSLRLLGQVSTHNASQIQPSMNSIGLNDTLQIWLSCPATKMLIDLTTQCLEGLSQSETDACINALLETSVEHSPHFDWVVAHIGGCFPHTVVTRVLSCGLQDFVMYGSDSGSISPKLHSVVGILAHLSFSHGTNIQKAIIDLFCWSCTDITEQHIAVVPYLLQLSSLSGPLLDIIGEQIVSCINDDTIVAFKKHCSIWCSKYFGSQEALLNLTVQQIFRSRQGGFEMVKILLRYGTNHNQDYSQVCCELMEMVLAETAQVVQNSGRMSPAEIPFLQSLNSHVTALLGLLINTPDTWQKGVILRLLALMATLQGPGTSKHVVTYLLQQSPAKGTVPLIRRFIQSVQSVHTKITVTSIHEVLKLQGKCLQFALENLLHLVRLECTNRVQVFGCQFKTAFSTNLELFPPLLFEDRKTTTLAVKLLNSIELLEETQPRLIAKLSYSCVPHFFTLLSFEDQRQREMQNILSSLCRYPNGQALILRLIMQGVFSEEWKYLFGAKTLNNNRRRNGHVSLLEQNVNFGSSVTLPQRHSSVFHAGIIGNGVEKHGSDPRLESLTPDVIRSNINYLLDTLSRCCLYNADGMTQLSLLLVEIISPDVMFNGLPWPDEEFAKVTVERDLHVRRFIEDHVVIWDLLSLLAQNRPALCYCSIILRSLLAVLLSHWANCQDKNANSSGSPLEMTRRLIELMATSQLLPPPLCYLSEIIDFISPHEVHVLLKDVWSFMRDNVPSPSLFTVDNCWRDFSNYRMDPRYTERLRLILLTNISKVGHLYPRFMGIARNE